MTKILISRGYGAGWSTWHDDKKNSLTYQPLIDALENHGRESEEFKKALEQFKKENPREYLGGADQLEVTEVDGPFLVEEYDGSEYITTPDEMIEL